MQDMVWECKDGRRIAIADMSTSHIINCINLIRRRDYTWRTEYLDRFRLELEIRALNLSSKRFG